jgi:predicted Zn finger-like uncharacterized protein
MAFAVVCKSCQARFLLNDDLLRRKVAGKVVTVRCRQCHATIEVDASDVDPKALPENARPAPPPPLATTSTLKLKPAPAPPRPTKSATLMGIGSPARPGAATEMVALSPGFLHMSPAAPQTHARGFPEPPPPPGAVEDLSSGDWEIAETPAIAKADTAPESLDDFVEELPPSLPPPEEDVPSSSGIPSLKALSHHDEPAAKPRVDDFFSNMSAAMNGGVMAGPGDGAPTIDVSALSAAPAEAGESASIDMSAFDVPIDSKKTLPLFALAGDELTTAPAPAVRSAPSPAAGSLSPATVDRPARDQERPDSVRERKNVVAPATKSVPPAAATPKRSGLAAPVLLALAAAAGFLIWKRGAHGTVDVAAQPSAQSVAAAPEPLKAPVAENQPLAPEAVASVAPAPTAADDVTFESTPVKPTAVPTPAHDKAAAPAAPTPADKEPAPSTAKAPEPKAEPAPIAKEDPKPAPAEPAEPAEPAGPFDRAAAAAALNSSAAQASACRKEGDPSGIASVVITFAPSGRVTSANVSGPPFAGTPTGGCIAAALRKARVPAFDGDRVTVSKTIVIQ